MPTPLTFGEHPDRAERQDIGLPHPSPAHLHVADDLALELGHECERAGLVADGLDDRRPPGAARTRPARPRRRRADRSATRAERSRRAGRAEAAVAPLGVGQLVDPSSARPAGSPTTTSCAMRSPRPIFTASIAIEVHRRHDHLAPIARVDQPRGVCERQAVLRRETRSRQHESRVAVGDRDGDAGRDHRAFAGEHLDVDVRTQVEPGVAGMLRDGRAASGSRRRNGRSIRPSAPPARCGCRTGRARGTGGSPRAARRRSPDIRRPGSVRGASRGRARGTPDAPSRPG